MSNQNGPGATASDPMVDLLIRRRRGPAFLGIPIDVPVMPAAKGWHTTENAKHHTSGDWSIPEVVPARADRERAAAVLNSGAKVAILVGSAARGSRAEIEQVAEALGAPVVQAPLGKDVLPDDSPYATGGIALVGTTASHDEMADRDTLLMIGTPMPCTAFLPKHERARGVRIDIDPARVGLRHEVEVGLVGDSTPTLKALPPLLERKTDRGFLEPAREPRRGDRPGPGAAGHGRVRRKLRPRDAGEPPVRHVQPEAVRPNPLAGDFRGLGGERQGSPGKARRGCPRGDGRLARRLRVQCPAWCRRTASHDGRPARRGLGTNFRHAIGKRSPVLERSSQS